MIETEGHLLATPLSLPGDLPSRFLRKVAPPRRPDHGPRAPHQPAWTNPSVGDGFPIFINFSGLSPNPGEFYNNSVAP
jgi:hypothetical protein